MLLLVFCPWLVEVGCRSAVVVKVMGKLQAEVRCRLLAECDALVSTSIVIESSTPFKLSDNQWSVTGCPILGITGRPSGMGMAC